MRMVARQLGVAAFYNGFEHQHSCWASKINANWAAVLCPSISRADPANTPYPDIKSSSLLDLFVDRKAIDGPPFSASFFMTNALNYSYETYIVGLYSGFGFESRSIGESRMWGFRVRYDFGPWKCLSAMTGSAQTHARAVAPASR